jgi:putative ATP-dependent endonuclease of the OLD family
MNITKIIVENFRLLKDFSIDLEKELSLVIGKNNTGKTSLLSVLDKFLNNKGKFYFDDFNIEFKNELKQLIESVDEIVENDFKQLGIKLKLIIQYNDSDNLSNISRVMMDLDPANNFIVLGFEYILTYSDYLLLRKNSKEFLEKDAKKCEEKKQKNEEYTAHTIYDFLKQSHNDYFKPNRKSYEYDLVNAKINENKYINLDVEKISTSEIINFKFINARRDVTNRDVDKTLSGQTSRIYKSTEANDEQNKAVENFKDQLAETDSNLSVIYKTLFDNIIKKVGDFGGVVINESVIEIISTLKHRELLEGNTTVVYKHDDQNHLPEHYNGLGYMNLISMIFEIEILVHEFKGEKNKIPSDLNFLFIEEPEAHTHPQMQYIFIKNIKKLLKEGIKRDDGQNRTLQYIISTHSPCLVADSDFEDIKYLKKTNANRVISKNVKDLEKEYEIDGEEQNFRFLKQYLTINRAELFFADKAIFIEGDTERILLPAMMKKIDQEVSATPLLSQNISIVEVGAHSHIFEKFFDFIGIKKALIITDIDGYYLEPEFELDGITQKTYKTTGNLIFNEIKCSCCNSKAQYTSNSSLAFFNNGKKEIAYFKALNFDWKIVRKNRRKQWVPNRKGSLLVSFQTEENSYHARSFEDSFFHVNKDFIIDDVNSFPAITKKYMEQYRNGTIDVFKFSEKAVTSKPSLAIEILLNSKTDAQGNKFSNWQIPSYIKEGLLWLKRD